MVAYNYDFHSFEGLVLVNKRGTRKRSRFEGGASWTSRYGSVTFNQFGRDNPTTGINEKGLMISLMWLDGTEYPPADGRPATGILEWVQYNLDRHASVAEFAARAGEVRPASKTPIHFLMADAAGDAAVVEFLDERLVLHRGATLPVRALANSTTSGPTPTRGSAGWRSSASISPAARRSGCSMSRRKAPATSRRASPTTRAPRTAP